MRHLGDDIWVKTDSSWDGLVLPYFNSTRRTRMYWPEGGNCLYSGTRM
jgi:hypothetical protein